MARNKKTKEMTALEIESEILKQIELNDLDDIGEIVGVCGSVISKWKEIKRSRNSADCYWVESCSTRSGFCGYESFWKRF